MLDNRYQKEESEKTVLFRSCEEGEGGMNWTKEISLRGWARGCWDDYDVYAFGWLIY